jgi:hypothetical protein
VVVVVVSGREVQIERQVVWMVVQCFAERIARPGAACPPRPILPLMQGSSPGDFCSYLPPCVSLSS